MKNQLQINVELLEKRLHGSSIRDNNTYTQSVEYQRVVDISIGTDKYSCRRLDVDKRKGRGEVG